MSRTIYITGEISLETFKSFCMELSGLEDRQVAPIQIILASDGGDPEAGIAYYSRIMSSTCEINVHVYGSAHSSVNLILASGANRTMSPEAFVLIHDTKIDFSEMSKNEIKVEKIKAEADEQRWAKILSNHTKLSQKEWRKLSKQITYLSPKECLKYGIIDMIEGK